MERAPAWATGWGFRGTRATRSSAASSRSPMWQSALGLGCRASGGRKKKSTGPGLEPTTPRSSTQLLNHSDTRARCFPGLHFHFFECAWRFLQPSAGGTRRSAAAARATSNSPKSKWGIAGLDGVALERTPRRVLASPPGALCTTRLPTVGLSAVSLPLGVWWPPCSWLARPPRVQDPPPSSCALLQRRWRFLLRSGVGWGFAQSLGLRPDRVDRPPEMVSLSASSSCDPGSGVALAR